MSHTDHELMRRAMAIWQKQSHYGSADVTLRGFIGVFQATMQAVEERRIDAEPTDTQRGESQTK